MKGSQKLFAVLTLLILGFGFMPLLAQQLPYEGLDWLSYEAVTYYGDPYEPDDSRFFASAFTANDAVQTREFNVPGDEDWVWFTALAETVYTIETYARPLGSLADTVLELYDSNGVFVLLDDDGGALTDSRIVFEATYTGVHFVRVTEWADRAGHTYWYHLTIKAPTTRHYVPVIVRRHS